MTAHIRITNELAHTIALIATKHPEASIAIDWRDGKPEMFWFVTAVNVVVTRPPADATETPSPTPTRTT